MASKRGQRRRACASKHRYESLSDAMANKKRLKKKGVTVCAYACSFCGGFHVGHAPRRIRQSIRATIAAREVTR